MTVLPERWLGREWDSLTDLGSHGPSEDPRSGAVPTYCGVSMDTRMALRGGDASRHHAERRDHAPTLLIITC